MEMSDNEVILLAVKITGVMSSLWIVPMYLKSESGLQEKCWNDTLMWTGLLQEMI